MWFPPPFKRTEVICSVFYYYCITQYVINGTSVARKTKINQEVFEQFQNHYLVSY